MSNVWVVVADTEQGERIVKTYNTKEEAVMGEFDLSHRRDTCNIAVYECKLRRKI